MTIILNPDTFLILLIAGAVATPLAALLARRFRPGMVPLRAAIVLGALGPFALLYWFFYGVVLATLGFDTIASAATVVLVAVVFGVGAGLWAGRENAGRS